VEVVSSSKQQEHHVQYLATACVHITPYFSQYSTVLKETEILRNLCRICKNTQLGPNLDLNQHSNELICAQNWVDNKKV
jgi:hypothetical protein